MQLVEKNYIKNTELEPEQAEQAGAVQLARIYRQLGTEVEGCFVVHCGNDCYVCDRSCNDDNCGIQDSGTHWQ